MVVSHREKHVQFFRLKLAVQPCKAIGIVMGGNLRGFWTFKGRPLTESRVKRPQIEGLA
jgi:hypothetical protein